MADLSEKYRLQWASRWKEHLDEPYWLGRAMANTFERLNPADKNLIRPGYEDWLWYEKTFDMTALVMPEYNVLCYLLYRNGKRVIRMNEPMTVLRGLKGQNRSEALKTLDTKRYEFKTWW